MLDVIGESELIRIRSWPDSEAAEHLDYRIRELESQWKRTFVERGLILLEMEQRLLWKHLTNPNTGEPYTSLERWIIIAAPQSRSDAYAALRAVKELRDIPRERLEAIPRCNVHILQSLSTAVRGEPAILDAAKSMSEREFIRHVQNHHPLQHVESRQQIRFSLPHSAMIVVEQGIHAAMQREGLSTREQVLEMWACNDLEMYMEAEDGEREE